MRNYAEEFPHLDHLIGGYFHQDWQADGDTWEDVVGFFCRMERTEHSEGVVHDIEGLLKISETESQLLEALKAFGCSYRVDGSAREWLSRIGDIVRACLDRAKSHGLLQ